MPTEESLSRRIALVGTGAALFGSIIGVAGGLLGTSLQLGHEDAVHLRDKREALYTRVLQYERAAIERPLAQLIRDETRVRQGGGQPTAPPGFRLPKDPTSDEVLALQMSIDSPQRMADVEGLIAELEVYGSTRSRDLVVEFAIAEVAEYRALLDKTRSRDDDDSVADHQLAQARAGLVFGNDALAKLVRSEVARADD